MIYLEKYLYTRDEATLPDLSLFISIVNLLQSICTYTWRKAIKTNYSHESSPKSNTWLIPNPFTCKIGFLFWKFSTCPLLFEKKMISLVRFTGAHFRFIIHTLIGTRDHLDRRESLQENICEVTSCIYTIIVVSLVFVVGSK